MSRVLHERGDLIPLLAEVFREHGFGGASLALIRQKTGLGQGSLYHFFPGGKEEMAAAVLAEVETWFRREVFTPLQAAADPGEALTQMFTAVDAYFRSGQRVCLMGAFALGDARERFATQIRGYFVTWQAALTSALCGHVDDQQAADLAEEVVSSIQGALVLARALDDPAVFLRVLDRLRQRLALPGTGT